MNDIAHLASPGTARSDVAAAIRAHLAVARVKDSELARRIGMGQSAMSRRTNEEVAFDADDLGRIASVLGITVVELIQMPGGPSRSIIDVLPSDTDSVTEVLATVTNIATRRAVA